MFYRLSDQIALRSWMRVEGAYYKKGIPTAQPLTRREFDTLKLCDGEHDLEPGGTLASLAERGLILPCRQGEHPSEWSAYRHIENRYFPQMGSSRKVREKQVLHGKLGKAYGGFALCGARQGLSDRPWTLRGRLFLVSCRVRLRA